jgi:ankyrin repeat protein
MASASAPAAVEFGTDELSAIDLSDAAAADAPSEADASTSVSVTIKRSQFFPEGKPRLDSATSLWRAAEHGDIGRLKMLLDAGHDVNAMCEDPGWRHKTPLSAAVDGNEPLAVRLLLRRGANPDLRDGDGDRYPLHWASSFGDHDECAELLVQAGASLDARDAHGQTPLEFARRPFVGALGVVLGRGVELGRPKVEAVLSGAAAREATDGPRPTWSAEHAARALRHEFWKAAASGDLKVLERCLARYRQPVDQPRPASKSRLSALAIASYNGQLRAMASLLRHGADPNLAEAEGGFTPLHFCVHDADRSAATRVLLEARANPLKPKHDGLTPLDVARKNGCEASEALLASAVARIDAAEALEVLIRNVEGNWLIGRTTSAQLAAAIDRAAKTDVDATVLIRATEMKTALCAQEEAADGARHDAPTWAARRGWAGGLAGASSWAHDALSKLIGAVSGASTDPEEAGAPSGLQQVRDAASADGAGATTGVEPLASGAIVPIDLPVLDEAGRGPPGSMQELAFGPPGSMQELASMAADDSARVTGWRHDGRAIRAEAPSRAPQMSEPPSDGSEAVVSEASSADPVHVESAESSAVEDE